MDELGMMYEVARMDEYALRTFAFCTCGDDDGCDDCLPDSIVDAIVLLSVFALPEYELAIGDDGRAFVRFH